MSIVATLKEWAATRYGLIIADYQMDRILDRVQEIMASENMDEARFVYALHSNNDTVIQKTIAALTVQESYFYRDASLFLFLKNTLLPELIKTKRKQGNYQLCIWSAGCSYGEEIYSLAIYLHQLLPDIKQWKIRLLATDINSFALEKGKKAIFTQSSMRAVEDWIVRDYFIFNKPFYTLKDNIRDMVTFDYGNIANMQNTSERYDLIFCRNTFIYLDKDIICKAMDFFYEHLLEHGILFLGSADFFSFCHHKFSVQIINNLCLLIKENQPVRVKSAKNEDPVFSYSENQKERAAKLHTIRLCLDRKNYLDALKEIDVYIEKFGATALLYRYKGEVLIGLGDVATAITSFIKAIKLDPSDAASYFLKGLAEMDLKDREAAIASLHTALSIKPNFPEAAYHLALYMLQANQKEEGLKLLHQALNGAKQLPADKLMIYTNGSAQQFIESINDSIAYYQGRTP